MPSDEQAGDSTLGLRRFGDELGGQEDPLARARALAKVKSALLGAAGSAGNPEPEPEPPRVGRYLLLDKLGAGGMGVVHLAFDPQLERRVALKLVRGRACSEDERAQEQRRLLREGQVQAQLSHPNLVPVHDVEIVDGQLVLVMEYIEGRRLDQWLERDDLGAGPERRRAILRVFIEAGRGLSAAHRAGLVHRDFKPSNTIIDTDGRARVLDFGLALVSAEPATEPGVDSALSLPGAGTPRYMAPEQRAGQSATAASDQYAFCVSLWEALFDRHPGSGDAKVSPRALARILRRGLAPDPADRWPSMVVLLRRLAPFTRERRAAERWRVPLLVAVSNLVALVVVGSWVFNRVDEGKPEVASAPAEEPAVAEVAQSHDAVVVPNPTAANALEKAPEAEAEAEVPRAEPPLASTSAPTVGTPAPAASSSGPPRDASYARLLRDAKARAHARLPSARLVSILAMGLEQQGRVDLSSGRAEARWVFGFYDADGDEAVSVTYMGAPNYDFPLVVYPARNINATRPISNPGRFEPARMLVESSASGCPALKGRGYDSMTVIGDNVHFSTKAQKWVATFERGATQIDGCGD